MDEAYLDGKFTKVERELGLPCTTTDCQSDHNEQCTFIYFILKSDNKHFVSKKNRNLTANFSDSLKNKLT